MKLKYIGKKHLNSNLYKNVSICQKSDEVIITSKIDERFKNISTMKTSTPYITDKVIDLETHDKVHEIVSYFLRNNTIYSIGQKDDLIEVKSIQGRILKLRLNIQYKDTLKMIIEKYENDRLNFASNSTASKINIVGSHCSNDRIIHEESRYGKEITLEDEEEIFFVYASRNDKMTNFDQKFIDDYIITQINNGDIYMYPQFDGRRYNIYINDKTISIPLELKERYKHFVYNRIHEISQNKKKQLKLEGIK